jgi:uncharacterized RDD family membrane protein YckC
MPRTQDSPSAAEAAATPNASLPRSLAAVAYESLLAAALVLVTGFLTLPLVSPAAQANHELEVPGVPARVLSACVVFGVAGLYCVWMWTAGRRTLAMKTWRLWLVRRDGRTVDTRTAVIRYFALWIGPAAALAAYAATRSAGLAVALTVLNYAWALVDPHRQFLHDRIAGTRIVGSSGAAAPSPG